MSKLRAGPKPGEPRLYLNPNARLCKALLDRITDRAHITETGTESFRFRRTLDRRKTMS